MVNKAKELLAIYKEHGVDKNRILIKLPATWEGIKAGNRLKKSGIECNMTLVFNYV
jgi:transaldolase